MQANCIPGYLLESYATDGAHLSAEILAQKVFAQSDALENLGTTIRTDGRDAHLRHYLLQSLIHSLDVVALGSGIILLYAMGLNEVVEHSKSHVRTQGTGSVAQQQGCMHHLTYLAALNYEGCLHTLLHTDKMMVHSTHGKQ